MFGEERRDFRRTVPGSSGIDTISTDLRDLATLLEKAKTLSDILRVRDAAEAVRVLSGRPSRRLDAHKQAAILRLTAERKAGILLRELGLHGGDRRSRNRADYPSLTKLGISQAQSSRWQRLAAVSESVFGAYIERATSEGRGVSAAGLLRISAISNSKQTCSRPTFDIEPSTNSISCHSSREAISDIVDELRSHKHTLDGLIESLLNGNEQVAQYERRAIRYLSSEVDGLLDRLLAVTGTE